MAHIRMSAALAAFTVLLAFSAFPQSDAVARSLKLNKTAAAGTVLPGGFAPLNVSEYDNPQVQQIVNFTLDAIALKTNHTGFNHTGHNLRFHILSVKTQVVAGINYVLRLAVAARHFKRSYEAEIYKAIDGNVTLTYLHPIKSAHRNVTSPSHNVTEPGHAHNVTTGHTHNVTETGP